MKSKTISFDTAISKNILSRCWPLWIAYFGYLILSFTMPLLNEIQQMPFRGITETDFARELRYWILNNAQLQAQAGLVTAVLTVMVLFSHLFIGKLNTMMAALPVRRESVFLTQYLTGLLPMLFGQLLTMLLTAGLAEKSGVVLSAFTTWFLCSALGFLCFYGIALFCAMLTGNIVIFPLVYFALNFAASIYEETVRYCLTRIVFGMSSSHEVFRFLSPFTQIQADLRIDGRELHGIPVLAAYAAVGLLMTVLAMLLYRKRKAECVTDFVAIPLLRPIFRVCMGFGAAFVLAAASFSEFFSRICGVKAALLMGAMMLLGAVIGCLAAEMIIRRSVRIRALPWRELSLVCAVCILTVAIAETDITGYERKVPNPENVECIAISYDTLLKDPENILLMTSLHREIIEKKELYDGNETAYKAMLFTEEVENTDESFDPTVMSDFWLPVQYHMKNGSTLYRNYVLRFQLGEVDNPASVIGEVCTLLNSQEAIDSRMCPEIPVKEEYIQFASIYRDDQKGSSYEYRLSAKECEELWNTAMLPDSAEGRLSLYTLVDTPVNMGTQTNLRVYIQLFNRNDADPIYWSHSFRVFTFSERVLAWIEENTDIDWMTLTEIGRLNADALRP